MYVNRSKWYVILCVNNATVRFKAYNIFLYWFIIVINISAAAGDLSHKRNREMAEMKQHSRMNERLHDKWTKNEIELKHQRYWHDLFLLLSNKYHLTFVYLPFSRSVSVCLSIQSNKNYFKNTFYLSDFFYVSHAGDYLLHKTTFKCNSLPTNYLNRLWRLRC